MISRYLSYYYNGDRLSWEFFKYAVFSNYLFSYYDSKIMVRLIYPENFKCVSNLMDYYGDMFEMCYEFEYYLDTQVKYVSGKMEYLRKHADNIEPMMFLGENVAPTTKFDIHETDAVYFLDVLEETPEFIKFYRNIGIYERIYDDSLIFVPKSMCEQVLSDATRIQAEFGFNDEMMNKILQLIIQTRAILLDIPIKTIGKNNFVHMNKENMMFLSNSYSVSFR